MQQPDRILWKPLLLMALILLSVVMAYPQQAKKSDKLKQSRQKIEQEIKQTNELLEKTKKEKQSSVNQVKILAKRIKSREALLNAINEELKELELQAAVESVQIERMTRSLQALRSEYARMILQAHRTMNGRSKLMFIFSADDFNQAYQRLRYYQQYAAYRKNQAKKIETTRIQLNNKLAALEETRTQKLELKENRRVEKERLDQEKQDKDKAIKAYSSKEKELLTALKQKQQSYQKLNTEIEKAINAEIIASEERARKKEAKSTGGGKKTVKSGTKESSAPSKLNLTPGEQKLSSSFSANRGKLPWPCERGFIAESFGEHPHPVLKNVMVKNNGVDIMTEPNASIRSVFGGKVTKVMTFQHLHKVVIIRHGEYLTVYSNLGETTVNEGDDVKTGQVIGRVHAKPDGQRPELHFELWKGKTILNPESWLANR